MTFCLVLQFADSAQRQVLKRPIYASLKFYGNNDKTVSSLSGVTFNELSHTPVTETKDLTQ